MNSLRRWLYRPKRSDQSLLAQFYFADEELNHVAAELDSFEGRGDPERCAALVNQLRACQARVLNVVSQMMEESIKDHRALRDFRVKFPDDLCQENLAGQLWFGAECLAAGSSIMNKEVESACMRPLARALTKNLDSLRTLLREQCLQNVNEYTELIIESLIIFDKLFAEFELSYVSAMAPVKTAQEYDMIQEITVLFSETVQRALKIGLLSQDMIDEYDPALMFTIPRLAIACGTLIFKNGPLNPDNDPHNISEMFRPFQTLLHKIRELLTILTCEELNTLERALCSQDEPSFLVSLEQDRKQAREERRRNRTGKKSSGKAKRHIEPQEEDNGSIESELTAREIAERLEALALDFEATRNNTELGAQGGTERIIPAGVEYQNGEEYSSSSSPLSCSASDNTCVRHEAVPLDSSEHEDSGEKQHILRSSDGAHKEDLQEEMGAFSGNICDSIPDLSKTILTNIDSDENTMSDVKCENSSALNEKELNDDNRPIDENDCTHLNELGRYELNKCDSNDSGLHSEIMSNSGSMFTISSSDSNQQITTSESVSHISDQAQAKCIEDLDMTEKIQQAYESQESHSEIKEKVVSNRDTALPLCVSECNGDQDLSCSRSDEVYCENYNCARCQPDIEIGLDAMDGSSSSVNLGEPGKDVKTCLSVDESVTPSQQTNGDSLQAATRDGAYSIIRNSKEESPSEMESQPETEDFQDLEMENKNYFLTANNHESVSVASSQPNTEVNHSCDDSQAPKDSCDISLIQIDQVENIKHCDGEGDNLSCEASNTYHKGKTDISPSETDSSSDTKSFKFTTKFHQQPGGADQENVNTSFSALSLPPTTAEIRPGDSNISLLSSNDGSNATNAVNGQMDNVPSASGATFSFSPSNSGPSSKMLECKIDTASAQSSSSHASASQTQVNTSFKRSHHRGSKESRRMNRSSIQTRLSRDKKPKLCAAHSKLMLHTKQLDSSCYNSSETSSYTSDCGDQEEIALAIEAAENASRNNVRARFKSNSDMIHRLFVCISGVADQLQTNFAGDLRNILRSVFDMNCSEPTDKDYNEKPKDSTPLVAAYRAMSHAARTSRHRHSSLRRQENPPMWLPDEEYNECMACQVPFTLVRRRHHCRSCGKIFCGKCSSNYVPLPQFGEDKAVRVCNRCLMLQVTPFH